jgi:DivIVA domain-containing protein
MQPTFPRTRRWTKGYDRAQVDRFLLHVEASLLAGGRPVSPSEIRRVGFDLVPGGYDVGAVDEHLDDLEVRALRAEQAAAPVSASGAWGARTDLMDAPEIPDIAATGARGHRFARTTGMRRGYDVAEVDDFLDRLHAHLAEGGPAQDDVARVRTVVFRSRRGGYDEDAVDDFLDRVVEALLRRTL